MLISKIKSVLVSYKSSFMLLFFIVGIGCQNSTSSQNKMPELGEFKKTETPKQVETAPIRKESSPILTKNQDQSQATATKAETSQASQESAPAKPKVAPKPKPAAAKAQIKAKSKTPKISFEKSTHDFGEITEGDIIKHKFKFKNTGNAELIIKSASASCGCTDPSYPFLGIPPGEEGFIGVTYYSVSKDGPQKPEVIVKTNASEHSFVLYLEGNVVPKKKEDKSEEKIDSSGVGKQL